MRIAITGCIGSGKSYVCDIIRKHGYDVYNCDVAAKEIMRRADIRQRVIDAFGTDTYVCDRPSKDVLTRILLTSKDNEKMLNGIVHPAVADDFLASNCQVMECAILYTSGFDRLVEKIICVSAPIDLRINRVMERDKISRERAEKWIDCQMNQDEIEHRSDYVIVNDGSAGLEKKIVDTLSSIFI